MFVVMALVTTVATTPLVKALYPPWYQTKLERWKRGEIDWEGNPTESTPTSQRESAEKLDATRVNKLLVYLRLDSLASIFSFITLLRPEDPKGAAEVQSPDETAPIPIRKRHLEVHGLRIIELTERTSSVMQVTEGEEFYSAHDPVVNAFRTFSQLNDLAVSGRVAVVPSAYYAETLMKQASDIASDFALIPWSEYGSVTEDQSVPYSISAVDRFRSATHLDFVSSALHKASGTCNAGVFINNGFGGLTKPAGRPLLARSKSAISIRSYHESASLPVADKSHHIFFPFFGGVDDRVALRFVLQLARNPNVSLTIALMNVPGDDIEEATPHVQPDSSRSMFSSKGAEVGAKAVDNLTATDLALFHTLQSSLPEELMGRVTFREIQVTSATALKETLSVAQESVGRSPKNAGDLVVVGRTHAQLGDLASETSSMDLKGTIGAIGEQLVMQGVKASVLVLQAGGRSREL